MTQWSRFADLRQRLEKRWQSGELPRACVQGEQELDWRVALKKPSSAELAGQFAEARDWVAHWQTIEQQQASSLQLEWREIQHRQLGRNQLPVAVHISRLDHALKLIGRQADGQRLQQLSASVLTAFPQLDEWLVRRPLTLLGLQHDWPRLAAVIDWLVRHPRPGIYLRQLEIPNVDSKFIERHRGVLGELLDAVLPASAIDTQARGAAGFEQRYGFRSKPLMLRFRLLDPRHSIAGLEDLSLPLVDFQKLAPAVRRVFITENEINGLAFPRQSDALVIFGLGYGVDRLAEIDWLADRQLYYWGDIDSHGFAILDRLRKHYPQVRSLLMDRATLLEHRALWGREAKPTRRELPRLRPDEASLYHDLCHNTLGENLRLEQERISYTWLRERLGGCQ